MFKHLEFVDAVNMMLKSDTNLFFFLSELHRTDGGNMRMLQMGGSYPLVDIVTIDATLHNLMGMGKCRKCLLYSRSAFSMVLQTELIAFYHLMHTKKKYLKMIPTSAIAKNTIKVHLSIISRFICCFFLCAQRPER